jgi:hypothetical protein
LNLSAVTIFWRKSGIRRALQSYQRGNQVALAGAIWLVTRTTPSACAEVSMRRVAKVPGLFEKNFLEKNRRRADRDLPPPTQRRCGMVDGR